MPASETIIRLSSTGNRTPAVEKFSAIGSIQTPFHHQSFGRRSGFTLYHRDAYPVCESTTVSGGIGRPIASIHDGILVARPLASTIRSPVSTNAAPPSRGFTFTPLTRIELLRTVSKPTASARSISSTFATLRSSSRTVASISTSAREQCRNVIRAPLGPSVHAERGEVQPEIYIDRAAFDHRTLEAGEQSVQLD